MSTQTMCLHTYGGRGSCTLAAGHASAHLDRDGFPIPVMDMTRATWGDVYVELCCTHHLSGGHAETVLSLAAGQQVGVTVEGAGIMIKAHTNGPDPTNLWYSILPAPPPGHVPGACGTVRGTGRIPGPF